MLNKFDFIKKLLQKTLPYDFFGSVLHINFILLFRLRVYDGNKSVFPVS